MPAQDNDDNYIGVAQLYSIMPNVKSNNPTAFENILHKCDELDNLHLIMNDVLLRGVDVNYRLPSTDFVKSKMPKFAGSTLLHLTADKDDIDMFNFFIKKGADFTIKNDDQSSVVHFMIAKSEFKKYIDTVTIDGKLELDRFVESALSAHIEHNNPSNPRDRNGVSHFSVACMTNKLETVEYFLHHGVSIDEEDSTGYTPLHFAAKYGAVEVVQLLLKRGVNVNAKDSRNMTALHVLVEEKMKIWARKSRMMSMDLSDELEVYSGLAKLLERNEKIMKMLLADDWIVDTFAKLCAACTMPDTLMVERLLNDNNVELDRAVDFKSDFCPGYTAAHFAAHFNVETVKLLVRRGANMEIKDAKGTTPFDICLRGFKVEDIRNIILLRSDWSDITFLNGRTRLVDFLHSMREPSAFEYYLRQSVTSTYTFVRLDSPFCAGYTPLHLAVALTETCPSNWTKRVIRLPRYQERIDVCLNLGADVTAEDGDGLTTVHRALRLCENNVVSRLLRAQIRVYNPVDDTGVSHFHVACVLNCKEMIKKLVDSGVGVNVPVGRGFIWYRGNGRRESKVAGGSTPLHLVAEAGDLAMTRLMVKHDANVLAKDVDGLTPVERAIEAKKRVGYLEKTEHARVIDLLIKIGMNKIVNVSRDFDALSELFHRIPKDFNINFFVKNDKKRYWNIIVNEAMLEGVLKKIGVTMLHLVCYSNAWEQARELLDAGADVGAKVNEDSPVFAGCTPLHLMVDYHVQQTFECELVHGNLASLLLDHGADVTVADSQGQTPIHRAFERLTRKEPDYDMKILDVLLEGHKDFSVNPVDARGVSHLHVACFRNKKRIVNEFLNKGAKVNQTVDHFAETFGGYSPLHFAMIRPSKKIYSLLLKHRADANARDRLGNTPLHVAVKCHKWMNDRFFSSVLRAGADPNTKNLLRETVLEMLLYKDEVTRKAVASFRRHGGRVNVVNPITREGCLRLAVRHTFHIDESVFHEVMKFEDVTRVDENGSTAIHNVVTVDRDDNYGYSSFDAIERNSIPTEAEAIEILTSLKLDVDSKDKNGLTPLQIAVQSLNIDGIIGLLLNGADVNTVIDVNGKTSFSHILERVNRHQSTESKKPGILTVRNATEHHEILVFRVLAKHVHKLMFAKLHVSETNKVAYVEARTKYYMGDIEVYEAELEKLKKRQIGSTSLNLRDFLSETGAVAAYLHMMQPQRQEIDEFFENSVKSLHKEFPALSSLLKLQYRKAMARAELSSSAAEALNVVLGIDVPLLCSDVIVKFLTNEDLKSVIASVKVV